MINTDNTSSSVFRETFITVINLASNTGLVSSLVWNYSLWSTVTSTSWDINRDWCSASSTTGSINMKSWVILIILLTAHNIVDIKTWVILIEMINDTINTVNINSWVILITFNACRFYRHYQIQSQNSWECGLHFFIFPSF